MSPCSDKYMSANKNAIVAKTTKDDVFRSYQSK